MNSKLKPKIRFKGFTDDREQRKFNEYINLRMGHLFSPSDYVKDGKYNVITISNVKGDRYINISDVNTVDSLPSNINNYQILCEGDLLISLTGNIGRVSYNKGVNNILNYRVGKIEFGKKEICDKFIYAYLCQDSIIKGFIDKGQGGAQPNISKPEVENLSIMVPSIDEQIKIGRFFEILDNTITLHQRKCDKLVELKKSLLEKMFPQNNSVIPEIRFKGFTDDWEQRKLSDNLKNIQTGTNLLGSIDNLGTPLLKMGNIQRGYFTTDKLEYLKDYFSIEKENIANFGDFFFNTRNTLELVGKGATWFGISGKYAFNSNIARFTFEGINTTFFNYLYNTELLLKQVHSRAVGTTSVAAIYPQSLNTIEYMLPSYDEQSKIGDLLLNLDNLISLQQRKHDKLNKIKQSLLNDMFV